MSSRLVLVVEDDDLLRELIATALEVRGYAVQTAASISEAKRIFHATDPDGLVLDVDLGPGPNGFDFPNLVYNASISCMSFFFFSKSSAIPITFYGHKYR
jgi:DNA-binding response OmpR family regulator